MPGAFQCSPRRSHRRLSVGAGDRDDLRLGECSQRDFDLADHRHPRLTSARERWRVGRDAGAGDDEGCSRDAIEVVHTDVGRDAITLERRGAITHDIGRRCIGRVHLQPLAREQPRNGDTTLSQADDRDLALAPLLGERDHLSLSVLSAMNAQKIPMIQKRTTT
jgi:hypothetical protein